MLNASWVLAVAVLVQTPSAPPAPPPAERPLTNLLGNLRDDLIALPGRRTLVVVGAGAIAAAIARPSDHRLDRWAERAGPSRSYTPLGSVLGNEWVQGGAAIATYAIGTVQKSPEIAHIGSDLIRAQALNGVLTTGIKLAASRERPNGGGRSFPSGHSSATFASATVLSEHYGWKVGVPAYAFAGFIGWTRLRDREHFLSDVAFGSALGVASGLTVTLGHDRSSWTVAPAPTAGGAAIYLIKY